MPIPRDLRVSRGWYTITREGVCLLREAEAAQLLPAVEALQRAFHHYSGKLLTSTVTRPDDPDDIIVRLTLEPGRVEQVQGYYLSITPKRIHLRAHDPAGAFYGAQTLVQLLRQYGRQLPQLRISDHPDFARRGILLDISRDKVPTMATLRRLVAQMASFKMNELQLYTEHTFAYEDHALVWAGASPMTPEQIQELDALCRRHHIDLVPNQNSFGHLTRWLKHPPYAGLAEAPEGSRFPWGPVAHPYSIAPAVPGSIRLLEDLYQELLPNFTSRYFNVGCDETFDLGQGRSRELVERLGFERVYMDFLMKIHELVRGDGRTMMFWGDIVMRHPELVEELPEDVVALEWGYEADHPFERDAARYARAGVPFYVCPGTSTWCSLGGRTDNAIGNLQSAARHGRANGARGYLITSWGDTGHWDPLPLSYLGWWHGAAVSWCLEANDDPNFGKVLGIQALEDPSGQSGRAIYELGNAYKRIGRLRHNGSWLWWAMMRPLDDDSVVEGISASDVESTRALIDRGRERVEKAALEGPDATVLRRELRYTARLLDHAARRIDYMRGGDVSAGALAGDMEEIIEMHEWAWMARNRTGGLTDSRARLERCLREYRERL
jgi:hypothetical protein